MAFPESGSKTDTYIGVIIAEVAATLVLYIILKVVHFCIWGHLYVCRNVNLEAKQAADVDERRWDQDTWDVSFPVIFANHVVALAIPILYYPSIFMCVMGFVHFGLFLALVIVNIFIRDLEPGNGSRSTVSRIIWICKLCNILGMCLVNVVHFISGLAKISAIIANP